MTQGGWQAQGRPSPAPGTGRAWQQPQGWQQSSWQQPQGWQQPAGWQRQPPSWQQPRGYPPQYPQASGWRPPPRRRRGPGGVLFLVFSLVAVGVLGMSALRTLRGEPSVSEPVTSVAPEPSTGPVQGTDPEPGGGSVGGSGEPTTVQPGGLPQRTWDELPPPNSDDPNWLTLQDNALYAAAVPRIDGCPAPELAANMTDLERLATAQIDCLQAAYRPVLESLGLDSAKIPVYFYEGSSVDTPCGHVSAPALYCSSQGGAIYFGEDALNGAAWVDFGTKDVAGHEYGHHLQAKAGLFEAEYAIGADNEILRRLELQATCWGYAAIAHDSSVAITEETAGEFEPFLRSVIEDGIHGSKDSNAYWGMRGLYSRTLGNCNTWTVAAQDVD